MTWSRRQHTARRSCASGQHRGRRSAELLPVGAGLGNAFLAPCRDQLALKLGDAAHDRQHRFADIGGDVASALTERDEAAGAFFEIVEDVVQVAAGTPVTGIFL